MVPRSRTDRMHVIAVCICAHLLATVAHAGVGTRTVVIPSTTELRDGECEDFLAFDCPVDGNGSPVLGPDGVPGTSDDLCTPKADAMWSLIESNGSLSNATGPSTKFTASIPAGLLAATELITATDGGTSDSGIALIRAPLVVTPPAPLLPTTTPTNFSAFDCPADGNGNPDAGPDGVPGTTDDLCTPRSVTWSTSGSIGSLQSTSGATTTLDPQLPAGLSVASGQVIATHVNSSVSVTVTVQNALVGPLVVVPAVVTTSVGQIRIFTAWSCPLDAQGIPDVGLDGEPGTADDSCTLDEGTNWILEGAGGVSAPEDFAASAISASGPAGSIGSIDPTIGSSTTFTAAAIAPGAIATGVLSANLTGTTALAGITVQSPIAVPTLALLTRAALAAALLFTAAAARRAPEPREATATSRGRFSFPSARTRS